MHRLRRVPFTANRYKSPKPSESENAPVKKMTKKNRGRPRKQFIQETSPEDEDIPMTSDAPFPDRCTFVLDNFHEVDVDMKWLLECYVPSESFAPSGTFIEQEKHLTFLSETNPEFWDCVYPPYQELPPDWINTSPLEDDNGSGAEERQLNYLKMNFIDPNLGKRGEDSGDIENELCDSKEDEHYEWKDVYNCCVELDKVDKMPDSAVNINKDVHNENEEEKTDGIAETGEATGRQFSDATSANYSGEIEDQIMQPVLSEAPIKGDKVYKQRTLCTYCDEFVPVKDVINLCFPTSSNLERYLLNLSNGDVLLAYRMQDDMEKWGSYKVCKKHIQKPPGRVRLTKDRVFVPDDVAITKWRKRIKDDEDGQMMTFADATELGLTPMTPKRCTYCSQQSQHTISFLAAKQKENSFDLDIWIKALALGNEEVQAILQKNLYPDDESSGPTRRFLCASHFRRSSFVISDTAFRHIRLRKNETPIGDKRVNDILLHGTESKTIMLDKWKYLETPIPVKKEKWGINANGEIVMFYECFYVDLPQTQADGTVITHRFCCSSTSEKMICIACNVVRRDLIGIMNVRSPGLGITWQKEKRLPPIMGLWMSENKATIKKKMDEQNCTAFLKFAVAMWNDVDSETRKEFLQKRSRMSEEYNTRQVDRISAEVAISKLSPAEVLVRGDKLLTDVDSLEHLCVHYHSVFKDAYVTSIGYFPSELELVDYEMERKVYYAALLDKLKTERTRKRSMPPVSGEDEPRRKIPATFKVAPLMSHAEVMSLYMKRPEMEMSEWKKVFQHDHSYCESDGPVEGLIDSSYLDENLFPVVGHLAIPFQMLHRLNLTCSSYPTGVASQLVAVENSNDSFTNSVANEAAEHHLQSADLGRSAESSRGKGDVSLPTNEKKNELVTVFSYEVPSVVESDTTAISSQSNRKSLSLFSPSEKADPLCSMKSVLPVQNVACGSLEPCISVTGHSYISPSVSVDGEPSPPVSPSLSSQADFQSKSPKVLPKVSLVRRGKSI